MAMVGAVLRAPQVTLFPLSRHNSRLPQNEYEGSRRAAARATLPGLVRSRSHRQSIVDHHCLGIEGPHCKNAVAQLFRDLIHLVVGLVAFAHKDRKPHPIRRIDGMMFVVDQQKLFAWLRIRETHPARIPAIDGPAHSALSCKIDVRQGEKVSEILSWQPDDTKGHGNCPLQVKITFTPETDRSHPIPEHPVFPAT
jgi:hypothetical protein